MPEGLNPKDQQRLIEELTKYANEGASDDELRQFKDIFSEELKKKPAAEQQKAASKTPQFGYGTAVEAVADGSQKTSTSKLPLESGVNNPQDFYSPEIENLNNNIKQIKDYSKKIEGGKLTTDEIRSEISNLQNGLQQQKQFNEKVDKVAAQAPESAKTININREINKTNDEALDNIFTGDRHNLVNAFAPELQDYFRLHPDYREEISNKAKSGDFSDKDQYILLNNVIGQKADELKHDIDIYRERGDNESANHKILQYNNLLESSKMLVQQYPGVIKEIQEQTKLDADAKSGTVGSQAYETLARFQNGMLDGIREIVEFAPKYASSLRGDNEYNVSDKAVNVLDKMFDALNAPQATPRPIFDEKGKINGTEILPQIGSTAGAMATLIYGGEALGGEKSGLFASSYLQTRDSYYQSAKEKGLTDHDASLFADASAFLTSAAELVSPNEFLLPKGAKDELLSTYINTLSKGQGAAKKAVLKDLWSEIKSENQQEIMQLLGDKGVEYAANTLTESDKFDAAIKANEVKETVLLTTLTTGLLKGVSSIGQAGRNYNDALMKAASRFDEFNQIVADQVGSGQVSPEKADELVQKVAAFKEKLDKVPGELSDDKKSDIVPLLIKKDELTAEMETKDPAFAKSYEKQISQIDNTVEEIIDYEPSKEAEAAKVKNESKTTIADTVDEIKPGDTGGTINTIENERPENDTITPNDDGGSTEGTGPLTGEGKVTEVGDSGITKVDTGTESGKTNTEGNTTEPGSETTPVSESIESIESTTKALRDKKDILFRGGRFSDIDTDKMGNNGTSYGWGVNFSEDSRVADFYSRKGNNGDAGEGSFVHVSMSDPSKMNLLNFWDKPSSEQKNQILNQFKKEGIDIDQEIIDKINSKRYTDIIPSLFTKLGTQKKVSEFLDRAGIDGVKYENPDGNGFNYVIYNKNKIKVAKFTNNESGDIIGSLSESYHKAKKENNNPELVKAVEDILQTTETGNSNKSEQGGKVEKEVTDEQKAKFEANNQKAIELGFASGPAAINSVEKRTGVKYDNFEDIPPDVLNKVAEERGKEKGKREFTRKFLENKNIRTEIKEAVAQDEEAVYYTKLPLDVTQKEATEIIDSFGVEEAMRQLTDKDVNLSTPVRNALGFAIMNHFNEKKEYAKSAEFALEVEKGRAIAGTEAAQALNSFKLWYWMHPVAAIIHAQKLVRKQFDKKLSEDERLDKTKRKLKDINEKVAKKVVDNLGNKIDKAAKIEPDTTYQPLGYGDSNRLVTKKRYQDLKNKLKGKFHSGIDPEMIELAAFHLEASGRKFADFSKKMIKDLGTKVRPYLKSLYDAARKDLEKVGYEDFESTESVDIEFSSLLKKPIVEGLKDFNVRLREIILQHYTTQDFTGKKLADKIVEETGLSGSEATELASAVQSEFNRLATEAKKKELDKIFGKRKSREPKIKNLEDEIIALTNLGAFSEDELVKKWAEKMDYPVLTPENVKEIERLAKKVQDATDGFDKNEKIEDLIAYQANIKGIDWYELPMAIWYANMLSGIGTQAKNVVSNTVNSGLLMGNAMIQNRRYSKDIALAYLNGIRRGLLEAGHTLKTGYSPIRGKVDVPAVLERKKFTGFGKPLNYYKYVRRVMVAADVITYEGIKEMRAYQLALKGAVKDNSLTTKQQRRDKAAQLVGNRSIDNQNAKYKAEEEAQSKIDKINDTSLSDKEKRDQIDKVNSEINRRIFEIIEEGRPARIFEDSHSFAKKGTYNAVPEGMLGYATSGMNYVIGKVPLVRLLIPFTNIISNVANETLNYTPFGFISASKGGGIVTKAKNFTEQDKVDAYTKAAIGTSLMMAAYILSGLGDDDEEPFVQITANGTGDFNKNESLKETGWQPYSIKIGGKWYSYQYTPMVLAFSYIGNIRDFEKYRDTKIDDSFWTKYGTAARWTARTFLDATAISTLDSFIGAIMDGRDEDAIEKLGKNAVRTAKSFVVPALYEQEFRRIEDWFSIPDKQTQGTTMGNVLRNIPFARDQYFNKVNGLGRELPPDADLFVSGAETKDPEDMKIWEAIGDKGLSIASTSYNKMVINNPETGEDRQLTQQEFYDFSVKKGEIIRKVLIDNVDEFKDMDRLEAKKYLSEVIQDAHAYAKGWIAAKDKKAYEAATEYMKAKKEKAEVKAEKKKGKEESKLTPTQINVKRDIEDKTFQEKIDVILELKKQSNWEEHRKVLRKVLSEETKKSIRDFDKKNDKIKIDL